MRYLSACSGIEAATVAWHPLGWQPVAFSEIDKFPSAVLAHRYPNIPNLGDLTQIARDDCGAIELLAGGTPCQSFSVAGLRRGLLDPRGNLALGFLRLAAMFGPRWILWENVPGVLSSNGGKDFGTFLGAMAQLGYGFAYRVLDAQYVRVESHPRAVPQRRRRLFVVGCLGDWRRAAAVLFERESLSGHPAPRRTAGQGIATDVANCLRGRSNASHRADSDTYVGTPETSNAICARDYKGARPEADQGAPLVVAHSLRAAGFDASEDGTGRGTPIVTIQERAVSENPDNESRTQAQAVAFRPTGGTHSVEATVECSPSVKVGSGLGIPSPPAVMQGMAVRKLTPRECERLQGFPDDYTLIPYRGKPAADGPRYKALGNSMAVNVMRWLGERIQWVDSLRSDAR